ncbi:methyltransferase [Adhaeribacter swui]|uniref:tRNA1(Val) (adenine(37)-N6)-methyltransferase n=1 Tax=Adhaeribacter swui TaxID=2086471 RepID=A0A7G7GCN5_9BACT|nr:methyltransferase [Adhaeribacter swui]QNF34919.1 methyltransferase [Adhaeribacter swui]
MANSYFQFKRFRIEQDQCAMKVCTDSCLFGAWVPVENAASILDIGTGTGLLALMAAQRSAATIQAVEIDEPAAEQARGNFKNSSWSDRLQLFKGSLQEYEQVNTTTYDVIISNPPFYQSSLKSGNKARNQAMHTIDLPFLDLLRFCKKNLNAQGAVYLLLPPYEAGLVIDLANTFGLFLQQEVKMYTKINGKHIRSILQFRFQTPPEVKTTALFIRTETEAYTPEFKNLLQLYYLIF